tara:strand:- start:1008 stop:1196 length:189 start_codon:yes stop_codon:yes gene_type:complete
LVDTEGIFILKDKKAAKLIIKRAKKNPELYSKKEVFYAKMIRKQIKQEEKDAEQRLSEDKKE